MVLHTVYVYVKHSKKVSHALSQTVCEKVQDALILMNCSAKQVSQCLLP